MSSRWPPPPKLKTQSTWIKDAKPAQKPKPVASSSNLPKPSPKPKAKPKKKTTIEYVVTVMDLPPIYVEESSSATHESRMTKFRAGILKDGFVDGTDWHPPHRIVRVERRDAA